jgi:hypothetical protein
MRLHVPVCDIMCRHPSFAGFWVIKSVEKPVLELARAGEFHPS